MGERAVLFHAFEKCGISKTTKIKCRTAMLQMKSVAEKQLYLQQMLSLQQFHEIMQLFEDQRYAERRRFRRKQPEDESMIVGLQDQDKSDESEIPEQKGKEIPQVNLYLQSPYDAPTHARSATECGDPKSASNHRSTPRRIRSACTARSTVPMAMRACAGQRGRPRSLGRPSQFPLWMSSDVGVRTVYEDETVNFNGVLYVKASCYLPLLTMLAHGVQLTADDLSSLNANVNQMLIVPRYSVPSFAYFAFPPYQRQGY